MSNVTKKDIHELFNFMEELSWIMSRYNSIDIKNRKDDLYKYLIEKNDFSTSFDNLTRYKHENSNKNYLVGTLPKFFQDREIFEKNSDLSDFGDFLGIRLKNPDKKSRYEIIGAMLCAISEMDENSLDKLVNAIDKIMHDEKILAKIKSDKTEKYDWNSVIRSLSGNII